MRVWGLFCCLSARGIALVCPPHNSGRLCPFHPQALSRVRPPRAGCRCLHHACRGPQRPARGPDKRTSRRKGGWPPGGGLVPPLPAHRSGVRGPRLFAAHVCAAVRERGAWSLRYRGPSCLPRLWEWEIDTRNAHLEISRVTHTWIRLQLICILLFRVGRRLVSPCAPTCRSWRRLRAAR